MKTISTLLLSVFTIIAVSAQTTKQIDIKKSTVTWKGYKVTGSHTGTITIKSGTLDFKNDELVGGEFIINMNSISTTDLTGDYKNKLDGHLKSDDFFGVTKYPEATLTVTNVKANGKNAYEVTGNIRIKEKTESITFDLSVYGNKATANLKIDRSKFNVRYGSTSFFDGLKDKAIYDEFDLVVDLEF